MKKLFKKLSEQLQKNSIKSKAITEEEYAKIEQKVIYEDFVDNTASNLNSAME